MSKPEKLEPQDTAKPKPKIVYGTRDDEARAMELILQHGLQRLLNPKR